MLVFYNLIYIFLLPLLILRDLITIDKEKLKTISEKLGQNYIKQTEASIWRSEERRVGKECER